MHYEDKEQLKKWADIIEKARSEGKFDGLPKPPIPSPQTSRESFFGAQDTQPTEKPSIADVEYWKNVAEKSVNPFVLNEQTVKAWQRNARIVVEDVKRDVADVAQSIVQAPNPIKQQTVGKDQDLEPGPLGLTFSEKDIELLSDMKIKLHELENKLNEFEGLGKNASIYDKQIKTLKKKIDDLSTAMTQGFPYSWSGASD